MIRRIVYIALLLQMLLTSIVFAQTTQVTNGLNYLVSTQSVDGSWISGEESAIATSEAIETLKLLKQTGTANYINALSWLQSQSLESTNHIAERIYSLATGGTDSAALVSYMDELVLAWGGYDNFTVDNLDTAIALQALKAINYANQTTIQSAISYLLNHQNTNGGWGFDNGDVSNVYMTAIVSRVLQLFPQTSAIATAVNKATSFIITNQNSDGGFGTSVHQTALSYIALVAVTTDNTVLGKAAQYIINSQAADGSWDEDPYVTALALRALYYSLNKPLPPEPALATVTGTVLDASTNQALQGASAVLQSNTAINAISDLSGVFKLNNIPLGSQSINVSLAGYQTSTVTVNAAEGSIINLGVVPLSVNATTGIVNGTVTDTATGQPLAGVSITISGAYSASTTTEADGRFIFTGVTPGNITIEASFAGYVTTTGMGSVSAGSVLLFSPRLSAEAQSGTTGTLTGKVVSGIAANPVMGAVITVDGSTSVNSDAQGLFNINGIAAGSHHITISATGYIPLSYSVIITGGGITDMGIITLTSSAGNTSTITGVVTNAATNQPIAHAEVSVVGTSLTAKTATDGSYSISGILKLEFSLHVSATGYNSTTIPMTTSEYSTYNVDVALDPAYVSDVKINSLATDNSSYGANKNVNIAVTLENTGGNAYSISLQGSIIDKANNVVGFVNLQDTSALTLAANSVAGYTLQWNTAKYAPDNYNLVLKVSDIDTGFLLTQGSTAFTIRPDILIGDVAPLVNPQFTNVKKNETVLIRGNIVNWSNIDAGLLADCSVKDTKGAVIFSASANLDVPVSEFSYTFDIGSFEYTFTQSGEYTVEMSIFVNGEAVASGTGSISVAPSIRIEPTMKLTPDIVTPDGDKTIRTDIELKGVEDVP